MRYIKVSAIIVTYNRINILKNCLKHLINQNFKLNNIIIINNDSNDGTKEYLNNLHNDKIIVKNMKRNVGGSGGFSKGIQIAYEQTTSNYFWVMDDDSAPTSNSLNNLCKVANNLNNKFGFLCSNVRSQNNYPVNVPIVSKDWTEPLPSNLVKVKEASFVSLFFSRDIVRKFGLPIKEMFIWGDDYEYTTRISNNYKSYLVSNSIVIHESVSSNKGSAEEESIFNTNRIKFYEYAYRNYLYINRKYNGVKGVTKKMLGDIKSLIEIPYRSKNKRLERCFYIIIGMIKGFSFNPKIDFPHDNRSKSKRNN